LPKGSSDIELSPAVPLSPGVSRQTLYPLSCLSFTE